MTANLPSQAVMAPTYADAGTRAVSTASAPADGRTLDYCYTGPAPVGGEGFVYVVGFGETVAAVRRIKVGMTINPHKRVQAICRTGGFRGLPASVTWVSPPHIGYRETERLLLEWCVGQYDAGYSGWCPYGREYFADLDPQSVIEHVAQIVAALEVHPRPAAEALPNLGLSRQSAARRRRSA